jgi:hypothetical protein
MMGTKQLSNDVELSQVPLQDFRQKLALALPDMAAESYEKTQHLTIFDAKGASHPPNNYLGVTETFRKFKRDFLPQGPLRDPLGRKILIRLNNFPKLLNLKMKNGTKKKAHTVIDELERGLFKEEEYTWEQDRLEALFWIPEMLGNPDAIYRKKRNFGIVEAEEVYFKVYKKDGSPIKVLFTQRVGPKSDRIVITSYVTSRSTAKLYVDGEPLYHRELSK